MADRSLITRVRTDTSNDGITVVYVNPDNLEFQDSSVGGSRLWLEHYDAGGLGDYYVEAGSLRGDLSVVLGVDAVPSVNLPIDTALVLPSPESLYHPWLSHQWMFQTQRPLVDRLGHALVAYPGAGDNLESDDPDFVLKRDRQDARVAAMDAIERRLPREPLPKVPDEDGLLEYNIPGNGRLAQLLIADFFETGSSLSVVDVDQGYFRQPLGFGVNLIYYLPTTIATQGPMSDSEESQFLLTRVEGSLSFVVEEGEWSIERILFVLESYHLFSDLYRHLSESLQTRGRELPVLIAYDFPESFFAALPGIIHDELESITRLREQTYARLVASGLQAAPEWAGKGEINGPEDLYRLYNNWQLVERMVFSPGSEAGNRIMSSIRRDVDMYRRKWGIAEDFCRSFQLLPLVLSWRQREKERRERRQPPEIPPGVIPRLQAHERVTDDLMRALERLRDIARYSLAAIRHMPSSPEAQFVGALIHDVNNDPLTVVMGRIGTYESDIIGSRPLDWSQLLLTHELGPVVREVVSGVEADARKHDVPMDFLLDIAPDLEALTLSDPVNMYPLRRVLRNFIFNAYNYRREEFSEGEISYIHVFVRRNGQGNIVFSVTDNGMGMSRQHRRHFGQFGLRGENVQEAGRTGTGVGVYSALRRLNELGGRVLSVRSQLNMGTSIYFEVPGDLFMEGPEGESGPRGGGIPVAGHQSPVASGRGTDFNDARARSRETGAKSRGGATIVGPSSMDDDYDVVGTMIMDGGLSVENGLPTVDAVMIGGANALKPAVFRTPVFLPEPRKIVDRRLSIVGGGVVIASDQGESGNLSGYPDGLLHVVRNDGGAVTDLDNVFCDWARILKEKSREDLIPVVQVIRDLDDRQRLLVVLNRIAEDSANVAWLFEEVAELRRAQPHEGAVSRQAVPQQNAGWHVPAAVAFQSTTALRIAQVGVGAR